MSGTQFTRRGFSAALGAGALAGAAAPVRPNVLWIVAEDINPQLGCFGDTYADTPNLDRFAARGLRYRNCWSTAPVCAPARTSLIDQFINQDPLGELTIAVPESSIDGNATVIAIDFADKPLP
jgi:hypothetical protein